MKIDSVVVSQCATNCFICYVEDGRGFIVDPGDQAMLIKNKVTRLGVKPEAILITHAHFDHIGAVKELKEAYDIPVIAPLEEKEFLADPSLNMTVQWTEEPVSLQADTSVKDGEAFTLIGRPVTSIHTPGHTPGSSCFYFPEDGILISGDTLFCESLGRYDFPGGSGRDIIQSIVKKLFTLPEDTIVYPGHGEATSIAHEKTYNPVARFAGKL